jgi:hypothetical protein
MHCKNWSGSNPGSRCSRVHLVEMGKTTILLIGMKFVKILKQAFYKMALKEARV